jgi:hypothetical protein
MPAARYDIYAEQGTTFKLHLDYKYKGATGIDLSNFGGEMQVRKSSKDTSTILYLTKSGVTGGGLTGDFIPGINGVNGVGGISFNTSPSGATGYTGGILLRVDYVTMKNTPTGKHFYDLELKNIATNEVLRLIEGSFEISREITRT